MSNYESVNKIKSLQQHIESFTGKSYSDLTSAVQALKNGYGSSEGGGSGIIDVTELPTSGIDENAVYRVTESYKSSAPNIWVVMPDEETGELTVQPIATLMGEDVQFNIIEVDNIEDMIPTDTSSENVVYTANILRANGIAYLYIPVTSSDPIPFGVVLLETEGLDKGYTDDPYTETDIGIYTTTERYDTFQRWFIRESGEWKEITSYTETTKQDGITNIDILSGDITDKVFSVVDVISDEIEELDERWFVRRDGSFVETIREYKFAFCDLKRATIPHSIEFVGYRAFNDNPDLTVVTFKGKRIKVDNKAFDSCKNLTTINVPWSEGEVQNAPWGAINATINYNYTEG